MVPANVVADGFVALVAVANPPVNVMVSPAASPIISVPVFKKFVSVSIVPPPSKLTL